MVTDRGQCIGCGYCCKKAPCFAASLVWRDSWRKPCPGLRWHDGRFWCGLIEDAVPNRREELKKDLAIGAGCSSTLFNSLREAMLRGENQRD